MEFMLCDKYIRGLIVAMMIFFCFLILFYDIMKSNNAIYQMIEWVGRQMGILDFHRYYFVKAFMYPLVRCWALGDY